MLGGLLRLQVVVGGRREAGFEGPAGVVGSEGEESLDLVVGGAPEKRRWRARVLGGVFLTEQTGCGGG